MSRTLIQEIHQAEFWNTKTEVLSRLGQRVRRVEVHPVHLRQQHCKLQSVQLHLEDNSITRVVAKETHLRPESFKDTEHYHRTKTAYEVEIAFYDYLMSHHLTPLEARVPEMLYAQLELDSFFLVLEDLRDSEELDKPRGCQKQELNSSETKLALDWLSSFHARFLGVRNLSNCLWPNGTFWSLEKRQREFERMTLEWNRTCENFREVYPTFFSSTKIIDLAFRLQSIAAQLDELLKRNESYKTLVHGDFKTANLFFYPNDVAACDFQWIGEGLGVKDLIYLLYSSVSPHSVLTQEDEFLKYYYDAFVLKSGDPLMDKMYPWDEFKRDAEFAFLDYVRFLIGSMWGSVTPTSYIKLSDKINQGIHKRNPQHLVAMVRRTDELISTHFES
eukprot:g181.t1